MGLVKEGTNCRSKLIFWVLLRPLVWGRDGEGIRFIEAGYSGARDCSGSR